MCISFFVLWQRSSFNHNVKDHNCIIDTWMCEAEHKFYSQAQKKFTTLLQQESRLSNWESCLARQDFCRDVKLLFHVMYLQNHGTILWKFEWCFFNNAQCSYCCYLLCCFSMPNGSDIHVTFIYNIHNSNHFLETGIVISGKQCGFIFPDST